MRRVRPPIPTKPLSTSELAHAGGVSLGTVRKLERLGLLRCTRDYRGWRAFPVSEIARLRALLGWPGLEPPPDSDGDGDAADAVEAPRP